MFLEQPKVLDQDYLSAMQQSHAEAIHELQKINESLKLIKAQTENSRITLDKEFAENNINKRMQLSRVISNILSNILEPLDEAVKLEKELRNMEGGIKYCEKLVARKEDLPLEKVNSDEESDCSDSTVIELPVKSLNETRILSSSLEVLLQSAKKHLNELKTDKPNPLVKNGKTHEIKGMRVKIQKLPGETDGNYRLKLLHRCQNIMRPYGIPMYDFSISWSSGHALCALIHYHESELIDESYLTCKNAVVTLEYVSEVAKSLGVEFKGSLVKFLQQKRPSYIKVFNFVNSLYCNLVSYD